MAEVTETNELHTIIILKYKLLIKLYTNESLQKLICNINLLFYEQSRKVKIHFGEESILYSPGDESGHAGGRSAGDGFYR